MKDTILFSFIIPCYNAAHTLEKAVQSIYADGRYADQYEIILVMNGCTDHTSQLAQILQQKYNAEIRITESDKGVSKARNAGIRLARGQWIAFLDADDMLTESSMQCFIEDGRRVQADFILYGHQKGQSIVHILDTGEMEHIYEGADLDAAKVKIISDPTRFMQVWAKLFRRDIIIQNHILFHEQLKLAEDSDFTLRYLCYCNAILFHDEPAYHYSLSSGSTVRTYDGKKVQEYIYSMKESNKVIKDSSLAIQGAFEKYVLMHFNIAMVREVFCIENKISFGNKLKKMKSVSLTQPFADCIKSIQLKECRSARMVPIMCLKLRMGVFAAFIYSMRAKQNHKRENGGS